MKNIKLLILSLIVVSTSFVSCSKDEDAAPAGSHKVLFKAETSEDAQILLVTYTNASGDQTQNTSVNARTFNSGEFTVAAGVPLVSFGAGGRGTVNSTIKVQIYVDGQLVKENTSSGESLTATTIYSFQ